MITKYATFFAHKDLCTIIEGIKRTKDKISGLVKAQPISRTVIEDQSIMLKKHDYDHFLKLWHYHPEVELAIILESCGTRFVGDSIQKFKEGDIVIVGKNLPHLWLNSEDYFAEDTDLRARAHVVHFHESFPRILAAIPETQKLHMLFKQARRGIKFNGATNQRIIALIDDMFQLQGEHRFIAVLDILSLLAQQKEYELLASAGYMENFVESKSDRMKAVLEFIMTNFTDNISLTDVANHVNMNPSSFSRYFKRKNKKTFSRYLNEVRVGYACKLLIEEQYNITEICYRAGFNSVSNFNRRFKSLKRMTPTEYIANYKHCT